MQITIGSISQSSYEAKWDVHVSIDQYVFRTHYGIIDTTKNQSLIHIFQFLVQTPDVSVEQGRLQKSINHDPLPSIHATSLSTAAAFWFCETFSEYRFH